jgi:hypothetical protein
VLDREFIDWYRVPDHLPLLEKGMVAVAIVLFNDIEQVINDGTSSDSALVVAIVVEEAMQEDVLERFGLKPTVLPLADLLRREVLEVTGEIA